MSLIKEQRKKIKKIYLIKFGRFGQTTLYVIKKVVLEAYSSIYGSYNLVSLAPSMFEVCLGIMLVVTPITKALFLIDKTNAKKLLNDATKLKCLDI